MIKKMIEFFIKNYLFLINKCYLTKFKFMDNASEEIENELLFLFKYKEKLKIELDSKIKFN